MKKIFRNAILGLVSCCTLTFGACTDLDETLYDKLNDTNIDLNNETDLALVLGASVA